MAWNTIVGNCSRCGQQAKLLPAFGKYICEDCKNKRPLKGKGNAGLFQSTQLPMTLYEGLYLQKVLKSNPVFGKLFFEHYPESKGIPGRSFCYVIHKEGDVVGIIGFNSPPSNYKLFRSFFGIDDDNLYMVNNVFRITQSSKNLATKVMRMARRTLQSDHMAKWGIRLVGIGTFVEPPRTGALYKADNWTYLGMTKGIAMKRDKESWDKVYTSDIPKLVFAWKYPKGVLNKSETDDRIGDEFTGRLPSEEVL